MSQVEINEPNLWRLDSPGTAGWTRTARPGDPNKYFMVSADCHANEPSNLWVERIDARYRDRLPRVITDANGVQWRVSEGHRPDRLRVNDLEGEDRLRQLAGAEPRQRLLDQDRDGIDAEVIYPNKGLSMWATPDATFAQVVGAVGFVQVVLVAARERATAGHQIQVDAETTREADVAVHLQHVRRRIGQSIAWGDLD